MAAYLFSVGIFGGEMLKSPEILTYERKYDRQGA